MRVGVAFLVAGAVLASAAWGEQIQPFAVGGTVYLPPFIVASKAFQNKGTGSSADGGGSWTLHPWMHAAFPGFEILFKGGADSADIFLTQTLLDQMVPVELQARSLLPTVLVFSWDEDAKALTRELSNPGQSEFQVVTIPQLKFQDADSTSVAIGPVSQYSGNLAFQPEYVATLLSRRLPALPPWFVAGVTSLYQNWYENRWAQQFKGSASMQASRHMVFELPPPDWTFPRRGLPEDRTDGDDARAILLKQLLTEPPPRRGSDKTKAAWIEAGRKRMAGGTRGEWLANTAAPDGSQNPRADSLTEALKFPGVAGPDSPFLWDIWRAESSLWVRWAITDPTHARAKALWKFAALASVEPPSEAMFVKCFGFGFAEGNVQLQAYMAGPAADPGKIETEYPFAYPDFGPREATESEVARLIGDLQRKEVDFLRQQSPSFVNVYAAEAKRTFIQAYDNGQRDPVFMAAFGLYECDVGNENKGRQYLEYAVEHGYFRPQACVVLAQLKLQTALAKPQGRAGRLSPAQAKPVISLIEAIRREDPPQRKGYLLAAATWEHADFVPAPTDLSLLDEGLYYFRGDPQLILAAAQLYAAAGDRPRALAILERGLRDVSDPHVRSLFDILRARYTTPPA